MRCLKKEMILVTKAFLEEEDAIGVVEIVLITIVLISLVILFRDQLTKTVNTILKKVNTNAGNV